MTCQSCTLASSCCRHPPPHLCHHHLHRVGWTRWSNAFFAQCPTSGASRRSASPDTVAATVSFPEAPQCSSDQGLDDLPSALKTSSPSDVKPMEPSPLKHTQLPPNAGQGTLIKQLFAPHGAFAAPRMVCPPPASMESTKAYTAPGPLLLPSLLPRSYIRPMTMDLGCVSSL